MTDAERQLWIAKCGELLFRTLVEIRSLSWDAGNDKRIERLADITHNVPHFMVGRDDRALDGLRADFVSYARTYWPDSDPEATEYVRIIDMTEPEFAAEYRRTWWPWPHSAEQAATN